MAIVNSTSLESNKKFKVDFSGGNLSSDAGLLLINEFTEKFGFRKLIKDKFKTTDTALRTHKDYENLLQMIYQIFAAYFTDDCADELRNDPVMTAVLDKDSLASQPTLSRFHNRLDEKTLEQLEDIQKILRKRIYTVDRPENILLDIDSTLLNTYGNQEGHAFNYHYQANGYHPLVCFDGLTGDLLRVQLRNGSDYCCNGAIDFLKPLLDEYAEYYQFANLFLRADSGFATEEIYSLCETNGVSYVVRLKENSVLKSLASDIESDLDELTKDNIVDYAVVYGEFMYKAKKWEYPRRVVCKIEKPQGQMLYMYTFVVTNMDSSPENLIKFYAKRGTMENFIKECKNGFDLSYVSSSSKIVNANRVQIHAIAYNIFNWFRRLVLPENMKKDRIDTFRLKLLKVAVKVVKTARYIVFKLCSSCPYKEAFYKILENISAMKPLTT